MPDDSQESKALRRAIGEIERQLLPRVSGKMFFGDLVFKLEISAGRIIRVITTASQSTKIDAV